MTEHLQILVDRVQEAGGRLLLNGDKLRVEAPAPLPDELVDQLRAAKPELIDMLGRQRPDTRPGAYDVLLAVPPGVPEQWAQGVADLLAMPRPTTWPETQWRQLREDAFGFLRDHAATAARLGWGALDIFGIDPTRPLVTHDAMGLVLLLHGRRVVELHADGAVIESNQGQRSSFTRRPTPSARVPVWH